MSVSACMCLCACYVSVCIFVGRLVCIFVCLCLFAIVPWYNFEFLNPGVKLALVG